MRAITRLFARLLAISIAGILLPLTVANAQQPGRTAGPEHAAQSTRPGEPAQPSGPQPRSGISPSLGAPVVIDGKTLFTVQQRLFTFSPEERAKTITERVTWLSKQPASSIRAVHAEDDGNFTEIVTGEIVLATISDGDARAAGRTRQ